MNVVPKQEVVEASQSDLLVVDLAVKTEKSLENDPVDSQFFAPVTPGMF